MSVLQKLKQHFIPADKLIVNKVKKHNLSRVSVYGAGDLGMAIVSKLVTENIQVACWYDASVKEHGHTLLSYKLFPLSCMKQDGSTHLIIASEAYAEEMTIAAKNNGFTGNIIGI